MGISITSLAYVLPGQKNTNAELAERFGSETVAKIESISGILERRTAKGDTCASDLAVRAARLIFENSKISPKDIDLLIFATQTPDYLIPTTACIIQQRLGIDNSCAAFDINLGCSQFVYALATARAWICGGLAKNALVLCADTPTKIIDPLDRSTACIFGDGGAACTVSKSDIDGILGFSFGTDGKGFDSIIWPNSGLRGYGGETMRADKMAMDGFKIFTFAYKRVAESVAEVLKKRHVRARHRPVCIPSGWGNDSQVLRPALVYSDGKSLLQNARHRKLRGREHSHSARRRRHNRKAKKRHESANMRLWSRAVLGERDIGVELHVHRGVYRCRLF